MATEENYWRSMFNNNAKRIAKALGLADVPTPQTEEEARTLYLKWCGLVE
jgi:hypothetical protein